MLDGRYPSKEFGELRARIVWDRVAGTIRPRRGSRQLAIANAGTIPDWGLYAVTLPDGRRVGELDEEMVYEARPGQAFLLEPPPADRGDRPRPRDRHARRRCARRRAVLARTRLAGRRSWAGRSARSRAGRSSRRRRPSSGTTTSTRAPRATCSPIRVSSSRRRGSCRASERSSSSAFVTRSATGASACSRPTAVACTRPGALQSRRAYASAWASRPTRSSQTTASSCTCPISAARTRPERSPSGCQRPRLAPLEPEEVEHAVTAELEARRCSARAFARTPPGRS